MRKCREPEVFNDPGHGKRVQLLHLSFRFSQGEGSLLLSEVPNLGDLYKESGQTLESSFAAVSKLIFAPKYAFFSIFRDQILQDFAAWSTHLFRSFPCKTRVLSPAKVFSTASVFSTFPFNRVREGEKEEK